MREIKIAVVGNPNTGKSTLINALAKARLQVGNWPGVTVEKKEATLKVGDYTLAFVDLPGAYSLSPFSLEEKIARDYLFTERPDVILCVVDSTNLERNLYFVIQLMELEIPLVLALNLFDEAQKLGYQIDIPLLERLLGVKAIPTIATRGEGIEELKSAIVEVYLQNKIPNRLSYGEDLEEAIDRVRLQLLTLNPQLEASLLYKGLLIKLLEGDQELISRLNLKFNPEEIKKYLQHIEKVHGEDIESYLTDLRYGLATGVVRQVLHKPEIRKITFTERVDRVLLNRYLGIPIFLLMMWLLFKVAFDVANPYVDFVDETINGPIMKWANVGLEFLEAPEWLNSLLLHGILAGVGIVFSFLPVIGVIMLLITFLESSGYMARAAFLMDRLMRSFGVQGKSFIPMLLGFGCNVPSVYATRVLEQERERKLTIFLVPFMSCGARLPVYVVFVSAFFVEASGTILFSLYVLGIGTAILLGIFLHKLIYRGKSSPFIMELPPYRLPTFRDLRVHTWMKLRHFVIKAGTWILAINVVIWVLLNLPWKPNNPEESYLGKTGALLAPIFKPLGFGDWASTASLLAGSLAKEVVVSTMAQIYASEEERAQEETLNLIEDLKGIVFNFGAKTKEAVYNLISTMGIATLQVEEPEEAKGLIVKLQEHFTPLSALSFMIFVLLYWPCFVYGIAVRAELGSFKLYLQAILIHTLVAWLVSLLFYQVGRILGF
ncbi:MAG: ferrous iron transport protein B [Caldimicrobium sp.]|nr:ferrous iron transport protein B [Caldimicrobium sp.]MCX7873937.1 ferrous iron transport protein B [Caldimicrobium sp.]MDW8094966.1 ferrous iron transport protein B [Caldimicrobium sp.]